MRKIYTLFVMAILAMVGVTAQAASVMATVRVNNPAYASIIPYYSPGGTSITDPLEFVDNECEIEFPDGVATRFLKVTPLTPAGSEKIYLTGYVIYDCDGEAVVESNKPTDKMSYVTVPVTADGGIIDLQFGVLEDKNITINVEGTLSKIKVSVDGTNQPLTLGENKLTVSAITSYIIIRPQKVATLYSVTLNGEEVSCLTDGLEGVVSYYYSINNPADGDVINIVTDYPDKDCEVTFSCNYDDFIKTVRLNGEELYGWCPLTVKAGDFLQVIGDAYDYTVTSCAINGVTLDYTSNELSRTITEDTEFAFEVEYIERPGSFIFYVGGGKWDLVNNQHAYTTLGEGYTTLGIDQDTENPYYLNCVELPEGGSENSKFYVYINDEKQGDDISFYTLNLKADDIVKAYVGTSAPKTYTVAYELDGVEGMPVIVKDLITSVDNLDGHKALPGTRISISPADGQKITDVSVNGDKLYESWDGSYTFTVNGNCDVKISNVPQADKYITVKTNLPEGIIVRYAGEYDFELTSEETTVNLADYEADEWSNFIIIYPETGYTLESVLYNDVECVGNENYDWGGSIVVYELTDGDIFDVTVKEMVRDQMVMVYTSGLENGFSVLSEVTGMTSLLDDKSDGYHQVMFAKEEAPLQFQLLDKDNAEDEVYVYLNNEPVTYFYGYELYCQDGDVVKLYLTPVAPELLSLEYAINGGDSQDIVVKHDYVTTVEQPGTHSVLPGTHSVLPGTHVSIAVAQGKTLAELLVNGEAVAAVDGEYAFSVNENTKVEVNFLTVGIADILNDADGQIYNLQGIRMTRDLNQLPAGIYIINGNKVQLK